MDQFWRDFEDLLHRPRTALTSDEAASVEYLLASIDDVDGVPPVSLAQRWCAKAREVGRLADSLGRLPVLEDEGVSPEHIAWLQAQRWETHLCLFQVAYLNSIPGWTRASSTG